MVKTNLSDVNKACLIFNHILNKGLIRNWVRERDEFDRRYTNISNNIISADLHIRGNAFTPEVKIYRPKWFLTRAYATTYTGNYNYIGLNKYKLNRSIASIAGSIAHEWGHCFEYYIKTFTNHTKLNHGDNNPTGKENTFQYWLGRSVKRYVEDNLNELLQEVGIG